MEHVDYIYENHSERCPYCEQMITGSATYIMQHGITCRQQYEIRLKQIEEQSNNNSSNDKI